MARVQWLHGRSAGRRQAFANSEVIGRFCLCICSHFTLLDQDDVLDVSGGEETAALRNIHRGGREEARNSKKYFQYGNIQ